MHESEGSVITDIWRNAAANYNTVLRKAAEHEPISRNRVKGASEIKSPRLSMLLTGTFNQFRALVPSVENGYFSRLMTMVIRGTNPFNKAYVSSKGAQSLIPKQVGRQLLRVYEQLLSTPEREWSLTEAQKERLGEHLETEYGTLIGLLGENFHSAVIRMAVQIERIAMILTGMRMEAYPQPLPKGKGESSAQTTPPFTGEELCSIGLPVDVRRTLTGVGFYCSDTDYETAELIGNKILLHMAAAYRLINGDAQDLIPDIKPIDQRRILFDQLNDAYTHKDLASEARKQGISLRTVERWNTSWIENGLVQKLNYAEYKKVG